MSCWVLVCCSDSGVVGFECWWVVCSGWFTADLFLYCCFIALIVLLPFLHFFLIGLIGCWFWLLWFDGWLRCLCGCCLIFGFLAYLVCGCCWLFGCLLMITCTLADLVLLVCCFVAFVWLLLLDYC